MHIAESFASWLIKNGADEENRDVYIYGIECFVNEFISNALLLSIGYISDRLTAMILWLCFFTIIRTQLGGFHASTHLRCILGSTLIGSLCIFTYPFINHLELLILLLSLISLVIIIKIAPVIHKNHPVSENRIGNIRKRAIGGGIIELVFIIICLNYHINLAGIAFLALFSSTVLGLIGYVANYNEQQGSSHILSLKK